MTTRTTVGIEVRAYVTFWHDDDLDKSQVLDMARDLAHTDTPFKFVDGDWRDVLVEIFAHDPMTRDDEPAILESMNRRLTR